MKPRNKQWGMRDARFILRKSLSEDGAFYDWLRAWNNLAINRLMVQKREDKMYLYKCGRDTSQAANVITAA